MLDDISTTGKLIVLLLMSSASNQIWRTRAAAFGTGLMLRSNSGNARDWRQDAGLNRIGKL